MFVESNLWLYRYPLLKELIDQMVNVSFPIYGAAVAARWRRFRLSDGTDKEIFFFDHPDRSTTTKNRPGKKITLGEPSLKSMNSDKSPFGRNAIARLQKLWRLEA